MSVPQKKVVQADAPKFRMGSLPVYDSLEEERQGRKERLAAAYRVFAKMGYDEGVAGHLTYRDPIQKDAFWVNPFGMSFDAITASDLLLIGPDGKVVEGTGKPGNTTYNAAAFAIHHAIHTARPDMDAACHSHAMHGKAFSTLGRNVEITTQDSCLFYKSCALYDNFGGVVLADEEGNNIAKALGSENKTLILQNHGILSCGATIEGAVFRFIALEKHCEVLLKAYPAAKALGLDGPTIIGDDEAKFTHDQIASEGAVYFQAKPYFARVDAETKGSYKA